MAETQFNPTPDYYFERIGEQEYRFPAGELDIFEDVRLWNGQSAAHSIPIRGDPGRG